MNGYLVGDMNLGNFSIGLVIFCMNPWCHVMNKMLYINKNHGRGELTN